MATTTNYGWETPDDTDLVKDGAAAIRTLGNSVDTTTKNLNPETTLGDLAYRSATSNTNTRLGIGSAGQVLTVASGVPSWATPNVGDITEVQAGVGISIASGTGPIPVVTNSSTDLITTAGDLLYGTAADTVARLGIGTAGQVLKVNSGANAPEWGSVAGGMNFIVRTPFSNVSSQAFDGVFTSSYYSYLVLIEDIYAATGGDDLQLQFRYAGPTTQATSYYGSTFVTRYLGTSAVVATNNAAQFTISEATGASTNKGAGHFFVNGVGNTSEVSKWRGQFTDDNGHSYTFGGTNVTERTYTGFLLKSSSTNITGTVSIYGLAKA